ncbi:MAG: purine-nucleoside phosphorylase [Eubacteriales bacterium]|nr:purine-nucleoside phosphorylase [Eubacteriales bacterium]MDD3880846.1 purine-nucleoside phosphorylase [Eubacteriales bacterium]MDD4511787.1 purine-nucleoside phosphorylase [Eubacteriales bacterium]
MTASEQEARIQRAALAIENACGKAEIGIVLGSGLGDYYQALKAPQQISYADIPGFPRSTVPGHAGIWYTGYIAGKRVCMMRGRFHGYEGYDYADVVLPIRAMKRLGVETLLLTNAAGGVNTSFEPGDLMAITDYINFTGKNPLIGENLDNYGPRFPDMSRAYDKVLVNTAISCGKKLGLQLKSGVYAQMNGPSFETPAEIRMLRTLGADAVGMSTVPETIVARHMGMKVLGISCITNMAAGILPQPLSHSEVIETGERVKHQFSALMNEIVTAI